MQQMLHVSQEVLLLWSRVITGNVGSRSDSGRYSTGGGMYLWELEPGSRVEHVTVAGNSTAGSNGMGGGIYVHEGNGLTVTHSTVARNYAPDGGGGMVVFQPEGPIVIERTEFLDNVEEEKGGAAGSRLFFGAQQV